MAPIERKGQEKYETIWEEIRRSGFVRIRIDGKSHRLDEVPAIDHRRKHSVEVIVDRIAVKASLRTRIADTVEKALDLGGGVMHVAHVDADRDEAHWKVERFSQHLACEQCAARRRGHRLARFDAGKPIHAFCRSPCQARWFFA